MRLSPRRRRPIRAGVADYQPGFVAGAASWTAAGRARAKGWNVDAPGESDACSPWVEAQLEVLRAGPPDPEQLTDRIMDHLARHGLLPPASLG